ncbi:MAG: hypothetical protein SGI87_03355 [Flavobacteriales bacterium]|nr:hypothetical protein [Flavobacteriales bacterium]
MRILGLIADHTPFGGAAKDIAAAFGVQWFDGFAMDRSERELERLACAKGLHCDNSIVSEQVDAIVFFTGSAFSTDNEHIPIRSLTSDYIVLFPETAWGFEEDTPSISGEGLLQIAYMEYGKGRIVFSGEAAMFSAQRAGVENRPVGFNTTGARKNCRLLLDLMLWLGRK